MKKEGEPKDQHLNILTTLTMKNKIEALAKEKGLSVGKVTRGLIGLGFRKLREEKGNAKEKVRVKRGAPGLLDQRAEKIRVQDVKRVSSNGIIPGSSVLQEDNEGSPNSRGTSGKAPREGRRRHSRGSAIKHQEPEDE